MRVSAELTQWDEGALAVAKLHRMAAVSKRTTPVAAGEHRDALLRLITPDLDAECPRRLDYLYIDGCPIEERAAAVAQVFASLHPSGLKQLIEAEVPRVEEPARAMAHRNGGGLMRRLMASDTAWPSGVVRRVGNVGLAR